VLRTAPSPARKASYALLGGYTLLGAAVTGMAIVMYANSDPDGTLVNVIALTTFTIAIGALTAALSRPLFTHRLRRTIQQNPTANGLWPQVEGHVMPSSRTRTQLWLASGLVTGAAFGTVMLALTGSIWWVVYLPPVGLMAGLIAGSSRTWHEKERRGRSAQQPSRPLGPR